MFESLLPKKMKIKIKEGPQDKAELLASRISIEINGKIFDIRSEDGALRISAKEGALVLRPTASNVVNIKSED